MSIGVFKGSCHCGSVRFEVRTAVEPAARCNCSLCRRKGALGDSASYGGATEDIKRRRCVDLVSVQHTNGKALLLHALRHLSISPDPQGPTIMAGQHWLPRRH
jgi:hypothetical protein